MSDENVILLQLNSGDFSVRKSDSAASFRNTLATPLLLDSNKKYEVSLYDCWFPVNQSTSSIYINTNLVDSSIVGSQSTSSIFWLPYTEFASVPSGSNFWFISYNKKWYPLANRNINYIDISFTLSTGGLIPIVGTQYSTVTLAIREVQ